MAIYGLLFQTLSSAESMSITGKLLIIISSNHNLTQTLSSTESVSMSSTGKLKLISINSYRKQIHFHFRFQFPLLIVHFQDFLYSAFNIFHRKSWSWGLGLESGFIRYPTWWLSECWRINNTLALTSKQHLNLMFHLPNKSHDSDLFINPDLSFDIVIVYIINIIIICLNLKWRTSIIV